MTEPAQQRSPRDVLALFHHAVVHKSADELAELFAEDAVYEFPLLTPGRAERYEGQAEIRESFAASWDVSPVTVSEILEVVVHDTTDPEVIISEQQVAVSVAETGHAFTLPFLLVLRVRDGRITHTRDYADALRGALELDRLPAVLDSIASRA